MNKQAMILIFATLTLAACASAPQRKAETRSTPAPVEDRVVGAPAASAVPVVPATPAAPVVSAMSAAPVAPVEQATPGGYLTGDGPGADAPANLDQIPDAVPQSEPLHRYANRPYVALGNTYTPLTSAGNYKERGIASWYGKKFHGQHTSSGEIYDMYGMTAAHPTLPIPSYARVTNIASKKSVVVRVNDRGPFLHGRVMDLSYAAAYKLGITGNGSQEIEIESLAANSSMNVLARTDTLENKPLDKSEPAAKSITPIEKSASPVVNSAPPPTANSVYYLQLGAFKTQEAAESFMNQMRVKLGDVGKQLVIFLKDGLTRVHLGPYANQHEARSSAEGLKGKLGFKPMINMH